MNEDKNRTSKRQAPLPKYMHQAAADCQLAQVSVRIPITLREQFEDAQTTLRQHGYEMALVDVVRCAVEDAIDAVDQRFGKPDRK